MSRCVVLIRKLDAHAQRVATQSRPICTVYDTPESEPPNTGRHDERLPRTPKHRVAFAVPATLTPAAPAQPGHRRARQQDATNTTDSRPPRLAARFSQVFEDVPGPRALAPS